MSESMMCGRCGYTPSNDTELRRGYCPRCFPKLAEPVPTSDKKPIPCEVCGLPRTCCDGGTSYCAGHCPNCAPQKKLTNEEKAIEAKRMVDELLASLHKES